MQAALDGLLLQNRGKLYTRAVCLAAQGENTLYAGEANCPPDALFDLASLTKLLTTTMALILVGEGHFSLEDPVAKLLPEGTLGPAAARWLCEVPFWRLLAHSAGAPAWYPFYCRPTGFYESLDSLIETQPPVQGTVYSDVGYMLVGEVVCAQSGNTLPQNLARLNNALGTQFAYNPQNPLACVETEFGNRVEMAMCAERHLAYHGWRHWDVQIQGQANDGNCFYFWNGTAGHAGAFGTTQDLLALARLYQQEGATHSGKQLLPAALTAASLQDKGGARGLGWNLEGTFPHGAGHTGFTGTALWLCAQKRTAAALLATRLPLPGPPDLQAFRRQVFTTIYEGL